jgi:hypothetical protein
MIKPVRVECFNKATNLPGARQYFRQNEETHHRFAMMRLLRQHGMFLLCLLTRATAEWLEDEFCQKLAGRNLRGSTKLNPNSEIEL